MTELIDTGRIRHIQCEADGPGFTHYSGIPSNAEEDFMKFMSQFEWYTASRVPDRLKVQPDLKWELTGEVGCQKEQPQLTA